MILFLRENTIFVSDRYQFFKSILETVRRIEDEAIIEQENLKKMEKNFQREYENLEKYLAKTKSQLSSSPSGAKASISEKLAKISEILDNIRAKGKLIPTFKKIVEAAEINEEFTKSLDTVCLKHLN